jgi:hypothetical protein
MLRRSLALTLTLALLALSGCQDSTAPDARTNLGPVPADGQFDPDAGTYTLKTLDPSDGSGRPLHLALLARNLVVDRSASTVSIEVAIHNRSQQTLRPAVVVWLSEFVPAEVTPVNADILPPATLDPIVGPWGYSYDELLGADEALTPDEVSGFATWTFYDPQLRPFRFAAAIDFALQEEAARLGGRIFNDTNMDGLPAPDETGFGAGVVFVTGPSERSAVAEVHADGSYSVRVKEPGLYSLLYIPPPTLRFAPLYFTTPNPLQVLLTAGDDGRVADYLDAHFGIAPGDFLVRPIEFTERPVAEIPTDFFALLEASLHGLVLRAHVGFSGCGPDHPFRLLMSGGFRESEPVNAQIVLTHDGRGELCEAYFESTRGFDLGPLVERYREQYGRVDRIRLVLWANGEKLELWLEPNAGDLR